MLQTTTLKLFCVNNDVQSISNSITQAFDPVTANIELSATYADSRAVVHMIDNTGVTFHTSTEPSYIADEITNVLTVLAQFRLDDQTLYQKIVQQINAFTCITSITFARSDDAERTNYIVESVFEVAQAVKGFVYLPSGNMRDADGKCFIGPSGSDYDLSFEPVVPGNALFQQSAVQQPATAVPPHPPLPQQPINMPYTLPRQPARQTANRELAPADRIRQEKSIQILKARNIPYLESLNGVVQRQATPRAVRDIAGRATALLAVSVVGEGLCSSDSYTEASRYASTLEERFGIHEFLSPLEHAFLQNEHATEAERMQMSWRYECCAVMLWALGYQDLPYPSGICDVSSVTKTILNLQSFADLVQNSKPLSFDTILDQADLTLRYNWACVHSRLNNEEAPAGLDSGVVAERLQALNWLIGAYDRANWDQAG